MKDKPLLGGIEMIENNDVVGTEEVVKAAKLGKTKMNKNLKLFLNIAGIGLVGGAIGGLGIYATYKLGLKGDRIIADVVKETGEMVASTDVKPDTVDILTSLSSKWMITKLEEVEVSEIIEELTNNAFKVE